MPYFVPHQINSESEPTPSPPEPLPIPTEADALDAYSRVVVRVAEEFRPAVVNLRVGRGRNGSGGSGILFTPDGFLLTNAHVVRNATTIRLRLSDGQEIEGRVVGSGSSGDAWYTVSVVHIHISPGVALSGLFSATLGVWLVCRSGKPPKLPR